MNAFIALLKIAITGQCQPIALIDWNEIYALSQFHNVNNLICEALQYLPEEQRPSAELTTVLKNSIYYTVALEMNQSYNIAEAIAAFEENHIPVIMLKGWVMKQFYPRTDLRSMADTDIFMRIEDEKKVHKILAEKNYKCISYGGKKDNVYSLPPYTTIEMHKSLFMYEDDWNGYMQQIWERTELLQGYQCVYRMDKELFYVYMIAHAAKHLKDDGGIGVRAFLDLFVYRRFYQDELDYSVIERDLESLKLSRFAEKAYALAEMWFGERDPDPAYMEFGDYILNCGAYGNKDHFVMNNEVMREDPEAGKWTYIWRRAFPNLESMQARVPQLRKYPVLLPYYWVKRLLSSLMNRSEFIRGEIESAGNVDKDEMLRIKKIYNEWGLVPTSKDE